MTSTSTAWDNEEAAIFQAFLATGALLNPAFLLPRTATHGTATSRCAAAQPASRSSCGTREHSRATSHHPSPQHKFLVAEAYHCAVLFNKDTFEEGGHRLHSLVCSCAKRLRVGTRWSGCSGTVPVDTTFFSLPAHSTQGRLHVGQSSASCQATGNRCEACTVPHSDAQCLVQDRAKAQGFVSRSFVRPFR